MGGHGQVLPFTNSLTMSRLQRTDSSSNRARAALGHRAEEAEPAGFACTGEPGQWSNHHIC